MTASSRGGPSRLAGEKEFLPSAEAFALDLVLVSLLEGGYIPEGLASGVAAHLGELTSG